LAGQSKTTYHSLFKNKNNMMKKLFLAALLTITVAASSFARDNKKISNLAVKSFMVEYSQASNVSWTLTDNYYKAAFFIGDQKMEAFYNAAGEKVAAAEQ
jgi:hypothetical protein